MKHIFFLWFFSSSVLLIWSLANAAEGYMDLAQNGVVTTVIQSDDGCVIGEDGAHIVRVLNPNQCPDKAFVQYLNCFDKAILPKEVRPEECQ